VEGSILDGLFLQGNLNGKRTSVEWLIGDRVSTIAVVNNVCLDLFVWSSNFNIKLLTSILAGVAIVVNSVDGEASGLVVVNVSETLSLSVALVGIARPFDFGVEGGIFDGITVEVDFDVVVSRFLYLVLNIIGSVTIVFNLRNNIFRSGNVNLERIATSSDWLTVRADGMDGEVARALGLTLVKAFTLGV